MNNKLLELMSKMIDKKLNEKMINREPAIVISVDSAYKRAVVEFLSGSRFTLLNKSGEKLTAGESVWVEYQTLPSSGYIAMRNGEADPVGGGGGLILRNGIVVTADQSGVYATSTSSQQTINVRNNERTYYGSANNPIVVNGNLIYTSLSPPQVTIDGKSYYDMDGYTDMLSSKLVFQSGTYELVFQDRDTTYTRYCVSGLPQYSRGSNKYNYTSFIEPNESYAVVFYPDFSTGPCSPDQSYANGHVVFADIYMGYLIRDRYIRVDNTSHLYTGDGQDLDVNPVLNQQFGSQAEYNYSINLQKVTSLPPSLE